MFVSLSAVDRDSAKDFTKIALALAMAYSYDYDADFMRKFMRWRVGADNFIKRFHFPASLIEKAHRLIAKGVDLADKSDEAAELHECIDDFMAALGDKRPELNKELDLRKEDLGLLNDIRLLHQKDSQSAKNRIARMVTQLGDNDLNVMFADGHADVSSEIQELEDLVKKHSGKKGLIMPAEILTQWQEHAKAKGSKRRDHARYLELRKALNQSFKDFLRTLVRTSTRKYLPVRDVIKALNENGIPHNMPAGFVGNIDDAGRYYTTEGRVLKQTPSGEVIMNPAYDAKADNAYVCQMKAPFAAEFARVYTEEYVSRKKEKKFNVVADTVPKLDKLAKAWRTHLATPTKKEGVLATLCEFIYATTARVGNPNAQTNGERTFGATQLLVRHFMIDDHKVVVQYIGKSGGKQKHVIKVGTSRSYKMLVKNLKDLMRGKGKDDPVFTYRDKQFTGSDVSRYMRKIGFPRGFSVHKLRTARGTKMANDILSASPFKKGGDWSERDVNKWVDSELLKVGIELGHMSGENYTANTAIQNYISPEILDSFYSGLNVRPPAKIQKAIDAANKHKAKEQ